MFPTKQAKNTLKAKEVVQESFVPYFDAEEAAKDQRRALWTSEENYRYVMFLQEKREWFASETLRRQNRVFSQASKIVGTKNCKQIKSHHQKLLIKLKTIQKIIENYLSPLPSTQTSLKCIEQSKETSEVETPREEGLLSPLRGFQNQIFEVLEPSMFLFSENFYEEQQYTYRNDSDLISQFENNI